MLIQLMAREMIAQLRVGIIFFVSVIIPMQWLAVNTHLLSHHEWNEKHYVSAIDLTYEAFLEIEEYDSKYMS